MSTYALVGPTGIITNRIVLDDQSTWSVPDGYILVAETDNHLEIGGTYSNGVYVPPPAAPSPIAGVPQVISDRQFFQQLAVEGIVTQDEALAAVMVGTIPAALQVLIDAMPADQQFNAKMIVAGGTTFERSHPLTIAIGTAYGWTSAMMDAFFTAAYSL
jgi:hypothetical protein